MDKQENAKDAKTAKTAINAIKLIADAAGYGRTYLAAAYKGGNRAIEVIVGGDFCKCVTLVAGAIMNIINNFEIDADEREEIARYLEDVLYSGKLYEYE